jgi:hypothetical protein
MVFVVHPAKVMKKRQTTKFSLKKILASHL